MIKFPYKIKFLLLPFFILALGACESEESEDEIWSTPLQVNFDVSKTNTDNNYVSSVKKTTFKNQSVRWSESQNEIWLMKEIFMDIELNNGQVLEFGIYLMRIESNRDNLNLEENGNWAYDSINEEQASDTAFDEITIMINNNRFYCLETCDQIQVVKIEKVIEKGSEKSYVELNFEGTAYGWYDPSGEYQEVFSLSNGSFKGVIKNSQDQ